MKVLFDFQAFLMQNKGGVSKYFFRLMKGLTNADLVIKYCDNLYLQEEINLYHHPSKKYYDYGTFMGGKDFLGKGKLFLLSNFMGWTESSEQANKELSNQVIQEGEFDIFHPTYYDPYFFKSLKGKPFVLTIHDMIHEIFPELFPKQTWLTAYKKQLAQKASRIIVVSENTKKDLINLFNVEENKIDVIYHGVDYPLNASKSENFDIKERGYLLFVGNRSSYKNFKVLIKAFSLILNEGYLGNLICVGGGDFSSDELALLKINKVENLTVRLDVNDLELNYLYSNASCLIYPSLYEGFGMPIIEAGALGCPLVISDLNVFKEIASEKAKFFDPQSSWDLKDKLIEVLSSPGKYSDKEFYLNKYSWKKTVAETKKSYEKALKAF